MSHNFGAKECKKEEKKDWVMMETRGLKGRKNGKVGIKQSKKSLWRKKSWLAR